MDAATDSPRLDVTPVAARRSALATLWHLIKQVATAWTDDHVPSMGAALAYYTVFSMAPLLLIVVAVAGLVFGQDAARGEVQLQLRDLMGARGAVAVQDLLASVDRPAEGSAVTFAGLLILIVGATSVFGELQDALDHIWRVPTRAGTSGWLRLIRARLLSFGMILAIGFLLMVSLVVSATLSALEHLLRPAFGNWVGVASVCNALGSFLLVAAMFGLIYKVMPRARVDWQDVWIGATVTAVLFTVGKSLIGLYIGTSAVASAFGAAGSLVVVLVWVYYSAQIFLLGAEFTWVYANNFGSRKALAPVPVSTPEPVCTPSLRQAMDPTAALLFIINEGSGRSAPGATRQLIETALRSAGRRGELIVTTAGDLHTVARRAAATALRRRSAVVAVGGDGTINAVAQAAYAQGCNLGVVPMGTFNYFARTHGLSTDATEAVLALTRYTPVPVQVGQINDQLFLVNASLGLYPELLQDREAYKARFGRSRWVALGAALATLTGTHRQLQIRIEHGAEAREVTTSTLFVGNNRLQLARVGFHEAPALDEGCMAAVMLRPVGALAMLGLLWRGAIGVLGDAKDIETFKFHRMVVRPRLRWRQRTVKVAFDGEIGQMATPLVFRVAPEPLYLLRPALSADGTGREADDT